jgi:hypothetical protein
MLTASQQEDRAEAILARIAFSVEAWGGWECMSRDGQRGLVRVWNTLQTDLMELKWRAR